MPEIQENGLELNSIDHPINQFVEYVRERAGDAAADALHELYLYGHKGVMNAAEEFARGDRRKINIDRFLHWASTPQGHSYWQDMHRRVGMFTIGGE